MNFILKPFSGTVEDLPKVSGSLEVQCSELKLQFRIEDAKHHVDWGVAANSAPQNSRGHELWKKTCFELFLSRAGSEIYHEFNFSPSGEWDALSFKSYRDAREDYVSAGASFSSTMNFQWDASAGTATASVDLRSTHGSRLQFLLYTQNFEFQIATVLRFKNGEQSLYALNHFEDRPDFHKRELFRSYSRE